MTDVFACAVSGAQLHGLARFTPCTNLHILADIPHNCVHSFDRAHTYLYMCGTCCFCTPKHILCVFFHFSCNVLHNFRLYCLKVFQFPTTIQTMPLPLLIRRALYSLILIVLAAFLSGHRTLTDPIHFSRPRCLPYFLDLLLLQAHLWHQNNPNQLNLWPHIATSICICVYEVRINALTNWKFKFNRKFVAYFSVHSTTYLLTDSLEI